MSMSQLRILPSLVGVLALLAGCGSSSKPDDARGNVLLSDDNNYIDDRETRGPDRGDGGRDRSRHLLDGCGHGHPVPPGLRDRRSGQRLAAPDLSPVGGAGRGQSRRRHAHAGAGRGLPRLPNRPHHDLREAVRRCRSAGRSSMSSRSTSRTRNGCTCCCSPRGRSPGQGARAMTFIKPTATSTNTTVAARAGLRAARLHGRPAHDHQPAGSGGGAVGRRLARHHARRARQPGSVREDRRRHDRFLRG